MIKKKNSAPLPGIKEPDPLPSIGVKNNVFEKERERECVCKKNRERV